MSFEGRFSGRLSGPIGFFFLLLAAAVVAGAARNAAAQPASQPAQGEETAQGDETYHLKADRLSGSATSDEDVYTAIKVTVEHGPTTVIGDSARVYRKRELVEVMGNVKIVDGKTKMWGNEASYDRKSRLAILRGNVRIEEGSAHISGNEARFYRNENRSVIVGNPRMEDSTRTLSADQIEYDRAKDVVLATGNVVAVDRAESTTVRAGRIRYDRAKNYAWASQNPVLTIEESGGKSTRVRGSTMEFDNAKRAVVAVGDVLVERDKLRATGDRGEFYEGENRALLVGKPRAWDDEGEVRGDTLDIRFAQHRVQSVQVRPHAAVRYEAKGERGRGERTEAYGDTVTLVNPDEETRRAVVVGHARSVYWPSSADSAQGGRNVSSGDSIIVEFERGRARRATVVGGAEGTYQMAAEGDTSRANQEERVRYRGRKIVYDVDRNEVDVMGVAEVTYKELRLNAEKVTFNTKTEHMRAEGSPVLNDGKDRIVGQTMTYDLSIRRGTIYSGKTAYDKGYYFGDQIRKVSEDVLDVKNGSYTTCDLDQPHYHFGSRSMKIILRDKVVARPVVFYFKHIPVLALPFYVFPIRPGRHSGFQLPQVEFGSSSRGGKFVRNVGYYWAINDYLDATLWGDYYQDDRWIGHSQTRYQKRYLLSGEINSSFEHTLLGSDRWDLEGRHLQTLGTNLTLRGQANLTNSSQYRRDQTIGRSVLSRVQRNLSSNLSLDKRWSGASLNIGLLRNQDLDPEPGGLEIAQQLPAVKFSLLQRPIGHLARGKEPARLPWLSSTVFSFTSTLSSERNNFFQARPETAVVLDSLGFPSDTTVTRVDVKTSQTAARHDLTLADVRTLMGFLRISPSMSYTEVFYSRDAAGNRNQRAGVWRGGLSANTSIFGTFRPSLGPLRAVRHVVTPSIGFSYQPAYPKLNYLDANGVLRQRFTGVSGVQSLGASEARSMNFSLQNDVHVKWGDATQPKVLNSLIFLQTSGSYNFLASRTGQKPLSDLFSTLRLNAGNRKSVDMHFVHNPYDGKLLSYSVSSGIYYQGLRRAQRQDESVSIDPAQAVAAPTGWVPPGLVASDLPWSLGISVGYAGSSSRAPGGGYTPWQSSTRGNGSLGINPTTNWRVDYSAQYDFNSRKVISQNYSVKRDLHCWEAQFTRSISGGFTEYYFKINVKNLPEVYYEQGSRGLRGFGGINNAF